jgi:hypothetical protein
LVERLVEENLVESGVEATVTAAAGAGATKELNCG